MFEEQYKFSHVLHHIIVIIDIERNPFVSILRFSLPL